METEIGTTLREARIRRKIDLAEIEKQTKIRVRYLRALENEEWDLLPGPTYTRSFIRTYAIALGLDGERLADDFRRQQDEAMQVGGGRESAPRPPRRPVDGDGASYRSILIGAAAVAALIAVLLILGLTGGGDNGNQPGPASGATAKKAKKGAAAKGAAAKGKGGVSIQLSAKADVWVCAIAANGTAVVNGEILPTGTQRGPFRSGSFQLAFGNGSVDMKVDGKPFSVKDTPSPVGYQVTKKRVKLLPEGSRPDCT